MKVETNLILSSIYLANYISLGKNPDVLFFLGSSFLIFALIGVFTQRKNDNNQQ